jgi:hypothetical protein
MSLPKDFWEKLQRRTDAELHDAIKNSKDYLPEALEAIRAEWTKRGLSDVRAQELEKVVEARVAADDAKANEPLPLSGRIFCMTLWMGLWPLVLYFRYRSKGYNRKASQCLMSILCGIALTPVLMMLMGHIFEFFAQRNR